MPHVIRLARPWRLVSWSDNQLEVCRNFNRPTGLVAGQEVNLAIACTERAQLHQVVLNQRTCLATDCFETTVRLPIDEFLKPANQLTLRLQIAPDAGQSTLEFATIDHPSRLDVSSWVMVELEICV